MLSCSRSRFCQMTSHTTSWHFVTWIGRLYFLDRVLKSNEKKRKTEGVWFRRKKQFFELILKLSLLWQSHHNWPGSRFVYIPSFTLHRLTRVNNRVHFYSFIMRYLHYDSMHQLYLVISPNKSAKQTQRCMVSFCIIML